VVSDQPIASKSNNPKIEKSEKSEKSEAPTITDTGIYESY
jgi:hypothetical protein